MTPARRRAATGLVVLGVLVAGCSSLSGGGPGTVTPAAVPTDDPPAYPPGLAAGGVVDAELFAAAHRRALEGGSLTRTWNRTVRYGNGTLAAETTVVAAFAADRDRYRIVFESFGTPAVDHARMARTHLDQFADGDRVFLRQRRLNRTSVHFDRRPDGRPAEPRTVRLTPPVRETRLAGLFGAVERATVEAVADGGERRYRLTATAFDRSALAGTTRYPPETALRLVAVVGRDGLVHRYRLTYGYAAAGNRFRVTEAGAVERVGTTSVARPPWVEQVDAATANDSE